MQSYPSDSDIYCTGGGGSVIILAYIVALFFKFYGCYIILLYTKEKKTAVILERFRLPRVQ